MVLQGRSRLQCNNGVFSYVALALVCLHQSPHSGHVAADVYWINCRGEWNEWDATCSTTCGGGIETRSLRVTFNAADCPAPETRPCGEDIICPAQYKIRKIPIPGKSIYPGDIIFLKAYTGRNLDVDGDTVRAMRKGHASWQSWTLEKAEQDGEGIFDGDIVYLRSYTGKRVDVVGDKVRARFAYYDPIQALVVEKHKGDRGIEAIGEGDLIFLKAHTGKYINVVRQGVQARWTEKTLWQTLQVEVPDAR
eukprot:TRINITY_DN26633_c0_g1_i1.p1 TRINITY_DN26633_c0_g1~~TRINITY_DN26633_c0_g1_i1.p1  ORF type:complete len:250 (-),score=17.25 TRINITY_DN26633_c0_g1_i1:414-1163(-)